MKAFIAFAVLIVAISAVPQPEAKHALDFSEEPTVADKIQKAIEDASQSIKDAGLDPLYIQRIGSQYALPVREIFNYLAYIQDISSTGLSNIVINILDYDVINSRLEFDFEMPLIHFSAGAIAAEAMILSRTFDFNLSGTLDIEKIRVFGDADVSLGLSGFSLSNVDVDVTLAGINSDLELDIDGTDYYDDINDFFSTRLVRALRAHRSGFAELARIAISNLVNKNL